MHKAASLLIIILRRLFSYATKCNLTIDSCYRGSLHFVNFDKLCVW